MKGVLLIMVLMVGGYRSVSAQTWEEWFNQKKTQKKYLLEQIAALKVYGGYLKKGYGIAKDGLHLISEIKNGDLDLHHDYFNSLSAVNPVIKKYPKVTDIRNMQESILIMVRNARGDMHLPKILTQGEMDYLDEVFERLLEDCSRTTQELEDVVTPVRLQMTDDERINRIDRIFLVSTKQYKFARVFIADNNSLVQSRRNSMKEISNSRMLNGIK